LERWHNWYANVRAAHESTEYPRSMPALKKARNRTWESSQGSGLGGSAGAIMACTMVRVGNNAKAGRRKSDEGWPNVPPEDGVPRLAVDGFLGEKKNGEN